MCSVGDEGRNLGVPPLGIHEGWFLGAVPPASLVGVRKERSLFWGFAGKKSPCKDWARHQWTLDKSAASRCQEEDASSEWFDGASETRSETLGSS